MAEDATMEGMLRAQTALSEARNALSELIAAEALKRSEPPRGGPAKGSCDAVGEGVSPELAEAVVGFANLHWTDHAFLKAWLDENFGRLWFSANKFEFEVSLSCVVFHGEEGNYFVLEPGETLRVDVPTLLKIQTGEAREREDQDNTWASLRGVRELDRLFSVVNGFDWGWWPRLLELADEADTFLPGEEDTDPPEEEDDGEV